MKGQILSILFSMVILQIPLLADFDNSPKIYELLNDPIDVIIPSSAEDLEMLDYCIEGIKNNCQNVRRIIVVSPVQATDKTEWFDEKEYPFSKREVAFYLNGKNEKCATEYIQDNRSRLGWYYQQLLKLYAPYVIPGLSSNVLIVDVDTVFFRPMEFINEEGGGNYATSQELHQPYFEHAGRLLPGLKRLDRSRSGIVHHMLFQKPILDDLFYQVECQHQQEFWKAFCESVDETHLYGSGASEYEIYFNFAFARTTQVKIRDVFWMNNGDIHLMDNHKNAGYYYVTYHGYMRAGKQFKEVKNDKTY